MSFGTTLDRGVFPVNVPNTRFGNELCPIRGAPNRGPGAYDDEKVIEEYINETPTLLENIMLFALV